MYSSWYAFHQELSPEGLEQQCALARDYGLGTLIVDDGWQTRDNSRGYSWCGDWELAKLPDFAGHVRRVQAMGFKYLLWFSAAHLGVNSRAWARFRTMVLDPEAQRGWHILDPRFPEVRERPRLPDRGRGPGEPAPGVHRAAARPEA